jgi:hypothetical protein
MELGTKRGLAHNIYSRPEHRSAAVAPGIFERGTGNKKTRKQSFQRILSSRSHQPQNDLSLKK